MEHRFREMADELGYAQESVYLPICDSTLAVGKRMARDGAPGMTAILAGDQTDGRGRLSRAWSSQGQKGIYLTVILRPLIPPEAEPLLPLAVALGVQQGLVRLSVPAQIKWPNDIVAHGKKLCGILLEGGVDAAGARFITAGIGVNVSHAPEDFKDPALAHAASLGMLGYERGYDAVLGAVLAALRDQINAFEQQPECLLECYVPHCVTLGHAVRVTAGVHQYHAMAVGIAPDGALLIEKEGTVQPLYAADVSVRGVMGYV